MKREKPSKIKLSTETIRQMTETLDPEKLKLVVGGAPQDATRRGLC